jgi:pyruvate/2-oxoglutarate dehydrogenase complex dihydrolipoamide dehydrogenase (E3) component
MSAELQPDLCVIGGGPGGLAVALGATASGKSVVVIEKNALGGRRLTESIPRHVLLTASRALDSAPRAADFEIAVDDSQFDFGHIRQQIAGAVAAIAPNYSQARIEAANITVISGSGRFTGPDTCEAGGETIRARHFVIATGAVSRRLPIQGVDAVRPLDCAALSALDRPPERLIVIGADPGELALAQALRRFGSEVTILSAHALFAGEDEELAAPVRAAFARDGIVVHEGVRISRIEPRGSGVRVVLASPGYERPVAGSHVLLSAGTTPAVEGMGLAAAGVRYDEAGIETNARLATSNWRIHAIGAAAKGSQEDGAAEWHAGHVLRAILGLPGGNLRGKVPARIVWTSPPIGWAGASEAQARAAHRHICILRWPLAETERARIERQPSGHVKLITTRSGTILGAGIVGGRAEELVTLFTLAISKHMTANDIASIMLPYPALASAARSAGMTFRDEKSYVQFDRLLAAWNQMIERQAGEFRQMAGVLSGKARRMFR